MNWKKIGLIILGLILILTPVFSSYTTNDLGNGHTIVIDSNNNVVWGFNDTSNVDMNSPNNNTLYLILLFTIINILVIIPKLKFIGGLGMIILGLLVLKTIDVNAIISYIYFASGFILLVYDVASLGRR